MKTIAIIGTFDTKGREFKFLKDLVEQRGLGTLCIHTGIYEPYFAPDVSNAEVAAAVGEDIAVIAQKHDRALATDVMSRGAEKLVPQLFAEGKFDGIISVGGSGGTSLATPAMRALPHRRPQGDGLHHGLRATSPSTSARATSSCSPPSWTRRASTRSPCASSPTR